MAGGSSGQGGWAVAGLGPGSLIAGYRVEARIGSGGMAMVLRARDEALGRTVALKILAPALAEEAGFRERFVRESRAVAAVDHPHIIPVYAAGEANGVLYLAMRYVSAGDLRTVAQREGPLPGDRTVALLSPVASALDAAHRAGLVHRDVKPANILVDSGPDRPEHPYLSDFGLAKGSASSTGLTGTGQYLGTPDYSAPEQISGKPTGPGTDQYALGCVAYTILTGRLPFAREESMAVLWAHVYEQPPRVTDQRPDLPPQVDQVLARALAKVPDERFRTCAEFIGALSRALAESAGTIRRDRSASLRPSATESATWQHPANQGGRTPPSGGSRARMPHLPAVTALTDGRPRSPFEPISVPPVTTPAGPGMAPSRARSNRGGDWPRRRAVTAGLVLGVLLAGGGGYALWRSSSDQDHYYVGVASDGYVSVYQGSALQTRSTLKASMLTDAQQATLRQRVSSDSVTGAQQRIDQLATSADQCRQTYQQLATWQAKVRAYQSYLTAKARADAIKGKPPAVVANPGAMPAQLPNAGQCAPSTAFGIASSALPAPGQTVPHPAPSTTPAKSAKASAPASRAAYTPASTTTAPTSSGGSSGGFNGPSPTSSNPFGGGF